MKTFLLTLGFVLVSSGAFATGPSSNSGALEALLEEANSELMAGNTKAACRRYEKAVKLSRGQSYDAQLGWATALLKAKDPAAAVAPAAAAEQLGTNDEMRSAAAFLSGLAQFQNQPEDPAALKKAAASLEKAVELAPERAAPARVTLGYVYRALGESEKAVAHLRHALPFLAAESPMRREARIVLCTVRRESGELNLPFPEPQTESDELSKEDQAPVKLFAPDPIYSEAARMARIQGRFIARSIIDKDGCVAGLKALEKVDPALDESALTAVRRWVFEPATREGQTVDAYFNLTINFRLGATIP